MCLLKLLKFLLHHMQKLFSLCELILMLFSWNVVLLVAIDGLLQSPCFFSHLFVVGSSVFLYLNHLTLKHLFKIVVELAHSILVLSL